MATVNNALVVKKETVDFVATRVKEFENNGELNFPVNYIPQNALKSAWLILQETQNMDHKFVLDFCTKDSIANALLSMVVQGLNPDKKQCYFIAYGTKLTMQRSYFGSIAVAKMVNPSIEDIFGEAVYEGDEFEYSKVRGKNVITKHIQKIENVSKSKIIAAYATILYSSGKEESTVLTFDQVKQAWKQSKMNPVGGDGTIKSGSVHDKFTADMCVKTAINKACKMVINTSSDKSIVSKFAKETDDVAIEARVDEEISINANGELIDIQIEGEAEERITDAEIIEMDKLAEELNGPPVGPGF